jgi:hypothetical protein
MRKIWRVNETRTIGLPFDIYFERIKKNPYHRPFLYWIGSEGNGDIIDYYGRRTVYIKKQYKGIFLFKQVKNNFQKFIDEGNEIILGTVHPSRKQNFRFNKPGKLVLTDINHAYWRIAFVNGIISKKLYESGLAQEEYKLVRNMAMSTCGTEKKYKVVRKGVVTDKTVTIRSENKQLREIYTFIRYECYRIMNDLTVALGGDWVEYNTDGIKYLDTAKNRKIVERFLKREKMLFKHSKVIKKPSTCGGKGLLLTSKKVGLVTNQGKDSENI